MAAKIPMIATTTRSSIRVNPDSSLNLSLSIRISLHDQKKFSILQSVRLRRLIPDSVLEPRIARSHSQAAGHVQSGVRNAAGSARSATSLLSIKRIVVFASD
jgi:hypothetical protein